MVFCEDGKDLNKLKAFKYNLLEKLTIFSEEAQLALDPLTQAGKKKTIKLKETSIGQRHNSVSFVVKRTVPDDTFEQT